MTHQRALYRGAGGADALGTNDSRLQDELVIVDLW
jgi:hypothetical protein